MEVSDYKRDRHFKFHAVFCNAIKRKESVVCNTSEVRTLITRVAFFFFDCHKLNSVAKHGEGLKYYHEFSHLLCLGPTYDDLMRVLSGKLTPHAFVRDRKNIFRGGIRTCNVDFPEWACIKTLTLMRVAVSLKKKNHFLPNKTK